MKTATIEQDQYLKKNFPNGVVFGCTILPGVTVDISTSTIRPSDDVAKLQADLTALREAVNNFYTKHHSLVSTKWVRHFTPQDFEELKQAMQHMLRLANATTTGDSDHADQV